MKKIVFAVLAVLVAGGAVHARDFPLSVNETGPVTIDHESPSAAIGRMKESAAVGDVRAETYASEVQTPSSVNESAPWLTAEQASVKSPPMAIGVGQSGAVGEVGADIGASGTYEVQTPSSVNESAPWLTEEQRHTR